MKLHACKKVGRGKLHVPLCDWKDILPFRQKAKSRHDLVEGILISYFVMGGKREHGNTIPPLGDLLNQPWPEGRRERAWFSPSFKVNSEREAEEPIAQLTVARARSCEESDTSLESNFERSVAERRSGAEKKSKRRADLRSRERKEDGSSRLGCYGPDAETTGCA